MTFRSGHPIELDARARSRRSRASPHGVVRLIWLATLLLLAPTAGADAATEYRLKAAFIYNFANFSHWPAASAGKLRVCVYGRSPILRALEPIAGRISNGRQIEILQRAQDATVEGCEVVFVTESAIARLPALLAEIGDEPVLTVANSPGAGRTGAAFNMVVVEDKVRFEVNLPATRRGGLRVDPRVLRLATAVHQ